MKHSLIENAIITYADFLRICHVQTPADFDGFRVETNGLFTIVPGDDVPLTFAERAALSWHPTGHYDQPALALPCTVAQLKTFLIDAGLDGYIDEDELAVGLTEQKVQQTDDSSGGSMKKWTSEKLAELAAYRRGHTMPKTAAKFGITEQRIRQLLPAEKPISKGYSAFTHRSK
ncbi:MAG: helix-turn-helix domain-containing protein [Chloroflexales bacterium]